MKTLLSLLLISIALSAALEPISAKPKRRPGNIDVTINNNTRPRPHRSNIPIINAYYDTDLSAVEIEFNDCLGQVVIYIQNSMRQTIAKYICDTDMESMVFIPCMLDDTETYTIKFHGKDFEAEGYIYPGGSL